MVGDFVSPDYGWLKGKDGSDARVLFRCGKSRDGYQTTDDIIKQAQRAMDILDGHFPDELHVMAYDNATIHTARAPNALSARKMTLKPKPDFTFGEEKLKMRDGVFPDGTPQSMYYPDDHRDASLAGHFKGMRQLIKERREKGADIPDPEKLKAQCTGFKCAKGSTMCCCRRILYTQPDFASQKSRLEEICEARGYQVIFFPKYHPELNCIEQCWGFAKRIYRLFPPSSRDEDLERNVKEALDAVPLVSIRRSVFLLLEIVAKTHIFP